MADRVKQASILRREKELQSKEMEREFEALRQSKIVLPEKSQSVKISEIIPEEEIDDLDTDQLTTKDKEGNFTEDEDSAMELEELNPQEAEIVTSIDVVHVFAWGRAGPITGWRNIKSEILFEKWIDEKISHIPRAEFNERLFRVGNLLKKKSSQFLKADEKISRVVERQRLIDETVNTVGVQPRSREPSQSTNGDHPIEDRDLLERIESLERSRAIDIATINNLESMIKTLSQQRAQRSSQERGRSQTPRTRGAPRVYRGNSGGTKREHSSSQSYRDREPPFDTPESDDEGPSPKRRASQRDTAEGQRTPRGPKSGVNQSRPKLNFRAPDRYEHRVRTVNWNGTPIEKDNIWNDREYSITDLLMKDFGKGPFRPEFRGADLLDLAERFIEDARVTLHPHPYLDDEVRRAIHIHGENDKSECLACYGDHYPCDCPVVATAEMRRRLFEARRECILCRRQHAEGQKGHYQNIRECGDPECTDLPKHHRMTCSNYAIDKSRQSKIDRIEFGN